MDASLIGVITGGTIGVAGSIVGPMCLAYMQRRAERNSLTCALGAEIAALVDIVEQRQYVNGLRLVIEAARQSPNPDTSFFYQFSVRRNPFSVYDANLSRIGLLKPSLSSRVVRFYSLGTAILEDIADFNEGRIPGGSDDSIRRLEEVLRLFETIQLLGQEILTEIGNVRNDA